ncbi:ankyrin repeat domain-containing protein [Aquimarina sp. SS2-1]|uniref:ankyrin repeat domain-containing protein n=1 Tax=Aquimarina besae TaxID=3342247 RepID=UPI003670E2E1
MFLNNDNDKPMDTIFNAIRSGNLEAVRGFLEKDKNLVHIKDERGSTPLLLSSYYGFLDIVKLILSYGPNIDEQDASGNTALMGVSFKGNYEIAALLIAEGADVNVKSYNDATALIFAATFGQKEIMRLLIQHGADISAKDNNGHTAEMHAENQGIDFGELLKVTR